MRFFFVIIGCMMFLSACGQTGALQLTSDPHYDHRSKYLIHQPTTKQSSDKTAQE